MLDFTESDYSTRMRRRHHELRADVSPEVFLVLLDLLSEFAEGGVFLLEALDFDLQLNQSLSQLSGLDLLNWGHVHRE